MTACNPSLSQAAHRPRPTSESLRRFFYPRSIAVVGASEGVSHLKGILEFMKDSRITIELVNPTRPQVHGIETRASLSDIATPPDAVLSLVNNERTLAVVAEAAGIGAGGVVVFAGGFRESDDRGKAMEAALIDAACGMPLLGPNCNGYSDFRRRVKVSAHPPVKALSGSTGLVTHSGGMIGAFALSGRDRAIGLTHAISVGNEATVDLVDCMEFLIDDPATKVICLVIEQIGRPAAFFEATARAHAVGKPIVALKLGRQERSQRIAKSHTGAIAGDAWIFDAAFRQHGILSARTMAEMLDRAACFEHLPSTKWSRLEGLAVLTTSGGGSSLASDVLLEPALNLSLPEMEALKPQLDRILPGVDVANPLDMTGVAVASEPLHRGIFSIYEQAPCVDGLMLQWFMCDEAMSMGGTMLEAFAQQGRSSSKAHFMVTNDDAGLPAWAQARAREGIGVFRGLESAARSLQSLREFMDHRGRHLAATRPIGKSAKLAAPAAPDVVPSTAGKMLTFDAAMKLLQGAGIATARYLIVDPKVEVPQAPCEFDEPWVVKLADVPHRTELDAVRLNVTASNLAATVGRMRQIAREHGCSASVVIQQQVKVEGEAFAGIQGNTPLGPFVLCGLGGIFVELFRKVAGARLPVSSSEVRSMLDELSSASVFDGFRGAAPWNREGLIEIICALGALGLAASDWLETIDINPLAVVDGQFVALDCLCLVRD